MVAVVTNLYLGRATLTNSEPKQSCVTSILCRVCYRKIINVCGRENSPSFCSFAKPDKLKQHYVFNEVWIWDLVNPCFFLLKHVCHFTDKRIADLVTLCISCRFLPLRSRRRYRPAGLAGTFSLLNDKCHFIKESLSTLLRDNIQNSSPAKQLDSGLLQGDVFTSLLACSCR